MASLSSKTNLIRKRKHRKAGAKRKAAVVKNGTTPKFAVHKQTS